MNKLSTFSLAVFGGVSVFMLAVPADAATDRVKFSASVDEIRRYCERLDEDFWYTKRTYGCGSRIGCVSGNCTVREPPRRRRHQPPVFVLEEGGKRGGDTGSVNGGGGRGDGNGSSSRGGSSAGGPN